MGQGIQEWKTALCMSQNGQTHFKNLAANAI